MIMHFLELPIMYVRVKYQSIFSGSWQLSTEAFCLTLKSPSLCQWRAHLFLLLPNHIFILLARPASLDDFVLFLPSSHILYLKPDLYWYSNLCKNILVLCHDQQKDEFRNNHNTIHTLF
jgi:hypothetical protein